MSDVGMPRAEARPRSLTALLWRPVAASAAMWLAVRLAHDPEIAMALVSLLHDVAIGFATFACVLMALWAVAGRPDGPERLVLDAASGYLRARLRQ